MITYCISYQRDIKNCNILCSTESWLIDDMINIKLAGFKLFDRIEQRPLVRQGEAAYAYL
jgi:hypothetical protein